MTLKDWKERQEEGKDSFSTANALMGKTWSIPEGQVFVFNPPAIIGMSTTGGVEAFVQNRGASDILPLDAVNDTGACSETCTQFSKHGGTETLHCLNRWPVLVQLRMMRQARMSDNLQMHCTHGSTSRLLRV